MVPQTIEISEVPERPRAAVLWLSENQVTARGPALYHTSPEEAWTDAALNWPQCLIWLTLHFLPTPDPEDHHIYAIKRRG